MAKSQQTFNKKEKEKKRRKKRQDKLEKRQQRKLEREAAGKKSFEDLIRYVDEDGNLTTTPPDPTKKKKVIKAEDIVLGVPPKDDTPMDIVRLGTVKFFNDDKGFGFIIDSETKESIFVHINNTIDPIKEGNRVNFEVEMGPKGPNAIKVAQAPDKPKPKPAPVKKPAEDEAKASAEEPKPEPPKAEE